MKESQKPERKTVPAVAVLRVVRWRISDLRLTTPRHHLLLKLLVLVLLVKLVCLKLFLYGYKIFIRGCKLAIQCRYLLLKTRYLFLFFIHNLMLGYMCDDSPTPNDQAEP